MRRARPGAPLRRRTARVRRARARAPALELAVARASVDELAAVAVALRRLDLGHVERAPAPRAPARDGLAVLGLRLAARSPGVAPGPCVGNDRRALGREDEPPRDSVRVDLHRVARRELA